MSFGVAIWLLMMSMASLSLGTIVVFGMGRVEDNARAAETLTAMVISNVMSGARAFIEGGDEVAFCFLSLAGSAQMEEPRALSLALRCNCWFDGLAICDFSNVGAAASVFLVVTGCKACEVCEMGRLDEALSNEVGNVAAISRMTTGRLRVPP